MYLLTIIYWPLIKLELIWIELNKPKISSLGLKTKVMACSSVSCQKYSYRPGGKNARIHEGQNCRDTLLHDDTSTCRKCKLYVKRWRSYCLVVFLANKYIKLNLMSNLKVKWRSSWYNLMTIDQHAKYIRHRSKVKNVMYYRSENKHCSYLLKEGVYFNLKLKTNLTVTLL